MGKDFTTLSVERPSTLHRKNAVFEVECQTALTVRLQFGTQHWETPLSDYTHRTALSEFIVTTSLSDFTATISQSLDFKSCQLQRATTTVWDRSVRFFFFFCTIRSYYHNVGQHCQILLPQCGTALSDLTTTIPDSTVVVIGF